MFGIAVIPSILLAVGMAFSPESPRWLFQVSVCNQKKNCALRLSIQQLRDQYFFSGINCSKEKLLKLNQL
jgi:hypothetical protein